MNAVEHYKGLMTAALALLRQGALTDAQDLLSDAIALPFPAANVPPSAAVNPGDRLTSQEGTE